MSHVHDHPLPIEGCWRCDLKARLITMRHELDFDTPTTETRESAGESES